MKRLDVAFLSHVKKIGALVFFAAYEIREVEL